MIEFLVNRERRIVLVRYAAELTPENLAKLDAMTADFAAREGVMDGIIDFRDIPTFNVPTHVVTARGRAPRRMSGRRRVFIVKDRLAFGMLRVYGAYQEDQGEDAPRIVYSLDEALTGLDAEGATFEPV
jgi:hypothetical protein